MNPQYTITSRQSLPNWIGQKRPKILSDDDLDELIDDKIFTSTTSISDLV